ncbi:S46 family peptidase [Culturomica massiliensis]|jgi:hypothetical protein|uniref:S46 family peptidase n=1 Tax=Culturomica massiliensis TaxID=1841857 RepID=UPI00083951F0|nr:MULTISPECIES: S46 family peptidase [Odoribacteraceae]RHV98548.1 S46 family peptidase [Odoribacter sp. OF09-27XD]
MKKGILLCFCVIWCIVCCRAEEGMWIPMLLKKYNIEDMQKKGFKLTAEDIYAINRASLKDAVVGLGREGRPFQHFCTGGLISAEGLVVTNHHCAFDMIQKHSSLEKNYLRDGFWAKGRHEELANPGITASVLVRMEDVTGKIQAALSENMPEKRRNGVIDSVCNVLEQAAVAGTDLSANIKPYFNGNQFFMSVFRIYKDVRLVAAPPSAIGNFGGDTDNWTWPRHTGDFSVLRIYAGENNEPAAYSEKNKPYRPAAFSKIYAGGLTEGDFTMVFGYPGTTNEYLPSYAVDQLVELENPHKIAIRTAKLNIIKAAMNSSDLLRIKYASKAAGVANAWKKWQGESKGLKRFKTVENKRMLEEKFQVWAAGKPEYAGLIDRYKALYDKRKELMLADIYLGEAGRRGAELMNFALSAYTYAQRYKTQTDKAGVQEDFRNYATAFFKDYDAEVDKTILIEMLRLYNENVPSEWVPEGVAEAAEGKGITLFAEEMFRKSVFTDPDRTFSFIDKLDSKSVSKVSRDPAYLLINSIVGFSREKVLSPLNQINREIQQLNRLWLAGLMEMESDKVFYPDANSTLRIAYGTIGGYSPSDAVRYNYYTTLSGIMEKDNPAIYDYNIPQKLRDIYASGDFGPYTQNGEVPVCFIANNHTTGGNSGSPVLNARGELIGLNFDRAWDGVMSDMQYDPEICRNIAVDIRYVLFIIDKIGDARYLLDEMEIVN